MTVGKTRKLLVAAFAALAASALVGPGVASAASQTYAPDAQARDFNGGAGGWTATDTQAGPLGQTLCIVAGVLICPAADNSYKADGGASGAGDGYANAHFSVLVGVAGSATSVWDSAPFTYEGVNGKKAKSLSLTLDRRTSLSELLALPSSSATYAVEIVPAGGGNAIGAGSGDLPATSDWTAADAQSIAPGALTIGDSYSIQITSEYQTGLAGVLEDGNADYDNVVLRAKRSKAGGGGGGGGGGKHHRFKRQFRHGLGPASEHGKRLFVKVKCPKSAKPDTCSFRVRALLKRSGPKVAGPKQASASPGHKGYLKMRVKPAFRTKVANRNRIWIRAKVTAGSKSAKVVKRVHIRH